MAIKTDLPAGFSVQVLNDIPGTRQAYTWTHGGQLCVTTDRGIYLRDEDTGRWQSVVKGDDFLLAEWSRSGNWLVALSSGPQSRKEKEQASNADDQAYTVNVIHRESNETKWQFDVPACNDILIRELIPDRPMLDIASEKEGLLVWDSTDEKLKRVSGSRPTNVLRIVDSDQTGMLASGYTNGDVVLDGPEQGTVLRMEGHKEEVRSLAWSPDGKFLVSGSLDGTICVFNPVEGVRLRVLDETGNGGVGSLGFTPDGRLLLASGYAGIVSSWRTDTWEELEFERDYDTYPVLGAMEMSVNPIEPELVAPNDHDSALALLRIDVGVLLGEKSEIRELSRSPSQADNPSLVDYLGRQDLVDTLAAMLSDKKQGTPFTIGIFGDWGSGKSSMFDQLQAQLEKAGAIPYRFATFNAWEFEHTDNLPAGLTQRVVEALIEDKNPFKSLILRIQFAWQKHRGHFFGAIIAALLALSGGVLTFFTSIDVSDSTWSTLNKIKATGGTAMMLAAALYAVTFLRKIYQHPLSTRLLTYLNLPKYGKHLGLIPVLRDDIKILSNIQLGNDQDIRGRLLVFVDDLDRCAPSSVLHVFEAIRLIMDTSNVVVLVALDARMSMQAIAHEYEKLATDQRPAEEIARDYIGKIFQLAITMKSPDFDNIKGYIEQGLFPGVKDKPAAGKSEDISPASTSTSEASTPLEGTPMEQVLRTPTPIIGHRKKSTEQIIEEMAHNADEVEHFESLCAVFRFTNPRLLRRLRNSYRVLKVIERAEGPYEMMKMLFWHEFLYTLPADLQVACEEHISAHEPLSEMTNLVSPELSTILTSIDEKLELHKDYNRLSEIVGQLVMPRQEPQNSNNQKTDGVHDEEPMDEQA